MLGFRDNTAKVTLLAAVLSFYCLGCAEGTGARLDLSARSASPAISEKPRPLLRAEAALQRLRDAFSGPVCVSVSGLPKPMAYSSSNGSICLTLGLVHLLNDDEISAVIAHELGHLTHPEDGDRTRFALGGTRTADEQRADAVGIILLRRSGIPCCALAHALAKVRDAPQTQPQLRQAMTARIALLPN